MTTEKMQALASSCIPSEEKEAILEIWNESRDIRLVHRFPISPFNDAAFILYLHKYVFWFQLKRAAISLLAVLLKVARKSSIRPSIDFEEYVDDCRALHWDYAFVDQIEAKEINKSWEWSNPKNVHGVLDCWHLIFRYWIHVLLKEQVVKSQSSTFSTWVDTTMKDTMFSEAQIKAWDHSHLRQCHWYIEMLPKATPPHEEQSRCQVQLDFYAQPPVTAAPLVKGKGKSTSEPKSKTGSASDSKPEATTKSGKRAAGPATKESSKRKKTTTIQSDALVASVDQVAESEAKSSKSEGRIQRGFTPGNSTAQRLQLINRGFSISYEAFFFNKSISELLAGSDRSAFHAAVA